MSLLRPINLPTPLIIQSLTSIGLGLYLTIFGYSPFRKHSILAPSASSPVSPRVRDSIRLLGITITILQSLYLTNSYMPIEENQFLAASVPARLVASVVLGILAIYNRQRMSTEGWWEFVGLAFGDGLAAIVLGLQLGRFDGMVANAERWL